VSFRIKWIKVKRKISNCF